MFIKRRRRFGRRRKFRLFSFFFAGQLGHVIVVAGADIVDRKQRHFRPGRAANRARERSLLPHVTGHTWEMEAVTALRREYGHSLPTFHILQTNPTFCLPICFEKMSILLIIANPQRRKKKKSTTISKENK